MADDIAGWLAGLRTGDKAWTTETPFGSRRRVVEGVVERVSPTRLSVRFGGILFTFSKGNGGRYPAPSGGNAQYALSIMPEEKALESVRSYWMGLDDHRKLRILRKEIGAVLDGITDPSELEAILERLSSPQPAAPEKKAGLVTGAMLGFTAAAGKSEVQTLVERETERITRAYLDEVEKIVQVLLKAHPDARIERVVTGPGGLMPPPLNVLSQSRILANGEYGGTVVVRHDPDLRMEVASDLAAVKRRLGVDDEPVVVWDDPPTPG